MNSWDSILIFQLLINGNVECLRVSIAVKRHQDHGNSSIFGVSLAFKSWAILPIPQQLLQSRHLIEVACLVSEAYLFYHHDKEHGLYRQVWCWSSS